MKKSIKKTQSRKPKNYLDVIKTGIHNPALDGLLNVIEDNGGSNVIVPNIIVTDDNASNLRKARIKKLKQNKNAFTESLNLNQSMFSDRMKLMMPIALTIRDALNSKGWMLGLINNKFVAKKGDHFISNLLTLRKMMAKMDPNYFLSGWAILNGWNKWVGGFNSSKFRKSSLNPMKRKKRMVTFK